MFKKVLLFILSFSFLVASEQAMIVLDASGSMWGKIDGVEKIAIAKDTLKKVVNDWDEDIEFGLISYGHRRKGDCSDIEVLMPVGKIDKSMVLQTVKGISPKGKTPISSSIKKAADTLRFTEEKATVILISDGKETCDANPCETAKELEKKGIDFTAHVIGFNVDLKTDEQLSCIAKATGGEYFSAKNASDLNKALKKVVKKVKQKPKKKELKHTLEITASETKESKPVKTSHTIFKILEDDETRHVQGCDSSKQEKCLLKLPAGNYLVQSDYNHYSINTKFTIKPNEKTSLHVVLGQTGKVEITASETKESKPVKTSHSIFKILEDDETRHVQGCDSSKQEKCLLKLPTGNYLVQSDYNHYSINTKFTIKPNEKTSLHVVLGQTGKVEITASETKESKPVTTSHSIFKILEDDETRHVQGCDSSKQEKCLLKLPVGNYLVQSDYNHYSINTKFTIKPNEKTSLHVILGQTGKVEITASDVEESGKVQGSFAIYKIIDDETSHVQGCDSSKQEPCLLKLPVGDYKVQADYKEASKEIRFSIKPNETTKLNIEFQ